MATKGGWFEDDVEGGDGTGSALDNSSATAASACETLGLLVAPVLDTCDRLESGPGLVELARLVLCRFGAGSGVPLLGKSSSTITSLLSF